MSETIKTYLLDDPDVLIPMDRKAFYKEQIAEYKENGRPSRAVEIVQAFLFNEDGELFVQKRSMKKSHNPGLLDKSIGGHIPMGDSSDHTMMVETIQEMQIPSFVIRSGEDFIRTYDLLKTYLSTVAIIRHIDTSIIEQDKIIDGEPATIAAKAHVYVGVYGGRAKTVDKEAKGILQYTLEDLDREMEAYPGMFTQDLKDLVKRHRVSLEAFVKRFSNKEE